MNKLLAHRLLFALDLVFTVTMTLFLMSGFVNASLFYLLVYVW